jgi:hypothetical protein
MIDTGGPAFPTTAANYDDYPSDVGMTLRDYFAAKVLQGFCAAPEFNWDDEERLAKRCYDISDAMLAERSNA